MKINRIVQKLTVEHKGGTAFFNALDDKLLHPEFCTKLYNMLMNPFRYTFICTGSFGKMFVDWLHVQQKDHAGFVLFPGSLRDGKVKRMTEYELYEGWTDRAVFIDDSIYSGTTRKTCLHQLEVPKDLDSFVVYDGSIKLRPYVHSLYRWHGKEVN